MPVLQFVRPIRSASESERERGHTPEAQDETARGGDLVQKVRPFIQRRQASRHGVGRLATPELEDLLAERDIYMQRLSEAISDDEYWDVTAHLEEVESIIRDGGGYR